MAVLRRQRKQATEYPGYERFEGDRDTEYVEVGHAYPLPVEMTTDTTDSLLSTEQFLGLIHAELVLIREAIEEMAGMSLSP